MTTDANQVSELPLSPQDLTADDIDNLMRLLGRVELKGAEARVYVGLELKLAAMRKGLTPPG